MPAMAQEKRKLIFCLMNGKWYKLRWAIAVGIVATRHSTRKIVIMKNMVLRVKMAFNKYQKVCGQFYQRKLAELLKHS